MTAAEGTRVTPTQGNACRPETATRRRTNFPVIPRRKRERESERVHERANAPVLCAVSFSSVEVSPALFRFLSSYLAGSYV